MFTLKQNEWERPKFGKRKCGGQSGDIWTVVGSGRAAELIPYPLQRGVCEPLLAHISLSSISLSFQIRLCASLGGLISSLSLSSLCRKCIKYAAWLQYWRA